MAHICALVPRAATLSAAARGESLLIAEIFALMRFRSAIGGTASGHAHVCGRERHREIGTAKKRKCDSDDADDFLHNDLLFFGCCSPDSY
jgi:hypothetical protein